MDTTIRPGSSWGKQRDNGQRIVLVDPQEQLAEFWPDVLRLLEEGREHWEWLYDSHDLFARIYAGVFQLWLAGDTKWFYACALTQMIEFPKAKVLKFIYASGTPGADNLSQLDFLSLIERWGREMGATFAEVHGRDGWKRKLKEYGYATAGQILLRKLGQGKDN